LLGASAVSVPRQRGKSDIEYLIEKIAELGSKHEQQSELWRRILFAYLLAGEVRYDVDLV
jgi:hypothetical protein